MSSTADLNIEGEGRKDDAKKCDKRQKLVPPEGMTKSAYKKLLKRKRLKEFYKRKKAEKKAKRKRMRELKRKENPPKPLSEEEKALRAERKRKKLDAEKKEKEEYALKCKTGQRVVLDLSFEKLMTEKEIRSLKQQVVYCYAANKRASVPFNLCLSSFTGSTKETLVNFPGFHNWIARPDERPYTDIFDASELVYLTSDSPNTIQALDPAKVYIIGGIVDRNRYKRLTIDKALREGISTAKLPISSYLKMSSTKVLTTNHVYEIMLNFAQSGDWEQAFQKVIPQRKNASKKTTSRESTSALGVASKDAATSSSAPSETYVSTADAAGH
eukprot:g886.t1